MAMEVEAEHAAKVDEILAYMDEEKESEPSYVPVHPVPGIDADKVEEQAVAAAAAEDDDEDVAGSVNGDEVEMEPVEPMPEPPDDAGPVCWPMPDFCPLTRLGAAEPGPTPSPDSRPSSSKRQRAVAGSPSSRSPCPYSNLLQVFQQCKQDVA
uniref:Uncharacterized protein n=1 Tax=Aegilops tauschii TaxID=37682 RepID=R7W641_AEGTA